MTLQAGTIGDGNSNCHNITSSFNTFNNTTFYRSDGGAQIMRWLSPLEPNNRHQGVRSERFAGVGDWLLETSEFQKWRRGEGEEDAAVIFCSGNPGVGKTYLSSLVIDRLCDQTKRKDIAVACFYCDYKAQQEQSIAHILGAILKQLVGVGDIPNYVREAFLEGKREVGGRGLLVVDLVGMLRATIASLSQVFICVDALDECLPRHLPELFKALGDIVRESPKTRVFLTGRPHIKEDVLRYFGKALVIPISPNAGDVRNYVEMRLAGDSEPEAMNDNLRADIIRTISEKISDIFLLVSLNMDTILGQVTIRQRRRKLEEMAKGNGLSDAYTATLTRLKAQKGDKYLLGMKVLMWVLYSERPLQAGELQHALGVEPGLADLDLENVPALRTLVAATLGLVTVEVSSSTVRLVHFTLQEHLLSDPTLFPNPHSTIAEVCLTYLNSGSVHNLPPTVKSAPSTMPLLEYASCYWGMHITRGMTENMKRLALRLLDRFDEHISAQLLLMGSNEDRNYSPYFSGEEGPVGFTGLHGAAFLGVVEMVTAVLEINEWDVNAADGIGITALIWAASNGHEGVVKLLLQRECVNPDQADTKYGRTPLSWAASNGHEGVVNLLLQREGVNFNAIDPEYGSTPLSWAATYGREGVVEILLQQEDIHPDQADAKSGRTPLSWAAGKGHEGIAKLLLQRQEVNPNMADTKGQTPLSWAAKEGLEGVVKMLLEQKDVLTSIPDNKDRTPLSLARSKGHDEIVKMLQERDTINCDLRSRRPDIPLAAQRPCK